jgi:hypothetical protein
MLWIVLLILTFLFGFLFTRIFDLNFFSSFSLGILFTSWIFFLSLFFNLGFYFAFLLLILANASLLAFYKKTKKKNEKKKEEVKKSRIGRILFYITLFLVVAWFISTLRFDSQGNLLANDGFYSDIPWHLGIQNFFAYSKKLELIFPYFYNTTLYYPFLPDFYIGMLIRAGIGSVEINILLNPILAFFLVYSFYSFSKIITKDELKAGFSTFLFFFASAGIFSIITNLLGYDYCIAPSKPVDSLLNFFFSGDTSVYNFAEVIRNIFTPQRGYLIAFPIDMLLLCLLFERKKPSLYFFILSLLPFFHSHSFIALSIFSLLWLKEIKNIKYFFILLISLPQVIFILLQPKANFFYFVNEQFFCGITTNPILARLITWTRAFGPIIIVGAMGWYIAYKNDKKLFEFSLPALFMFLIVNIISLQPSFGDNNKITLYFLIFLAIFSSFILEKKLLAIVFLILACENSFFYLWFQFQLWPNWQLPLFYKVDFKVAELIRNKTESDSTILSVPAELNNDVYSLFSPVAALTGRRSISTMDGYLGCVGIPYEKVAKVSGDAYKIYATWNCSLLKEYNISYVFIGRYEKGLIKTYPQYPNFQLIFNITDRNQSYLLYKVNCS